MEIKALQLESRFSLPPNSLGYCGRDSAVEKFKKCIITGRCDGLSREVANFIVLHPYLKTIAKITGRPKFSYPVIEAYWIGNRLLKKAEPEHYKLLLENFASQGVPAWLRTELRQRPPSVFIPNHLFQVLHVGVGRASGVVPYNLNSINNCMIRWGKVERISGRKTAVRVTSLTRRGGRYHLTSTNEAVPFEPELVPGLKVGRTVAVHWRQVIKILTDGETRNLTYWTNAVLKSLPKS